MRRKDKELQDSRILGIILKEADICRIAMCHNNEPYIVPMNFCYQDDSIYLHSAREGHKIGILRENPQVCFEIEYGTKMLPSEIACDWSMKYYSIVGWGKVEFIENTKEKEKALKLIVGKYTRASGPRFGEDMLKRLVVIKIKIGKMTGKKSGY